jgi:hypothetical protein
MRSPRFFAFAARIRLGLSSGIGGESASILADKEPVETLSIVRESLFAADSLHARKWTTEPTIREAVDKARFYEMP